MRLNKYIAASTELSRRAADQAITEGRVRVNGQLPQQGQVITDSDTVQLDALTLTPNLKVVTVMLNKPPDVVVSRDGQGSKTVYDILPPAYQRLNPIGRLDKYSSGLILLTSDGQLAQTLTHPSKQKCKVYEILLDKPLQPLHRQMISDHGLQLEDGLSKLLLERQKEGDDIAWIVTMYEGKNRQIRRTFESLGYRVTHLYRIQFGNYQLHSLKLGDYCVV